MPLLSRWGEGHATRSAWELIKTAKWSAAAAALALLISSLAFAAPAAATEDDPGAPVTQAELKTAVQNCVSVALKQKNQ